MEINNLPETANNKNETIELSLPVNPAYVSAARLTASSIANRMGFDINEIEDIKSAVSEACAFLIKKLPDNSKATFKITFHLGVDCLNIGLGLQTASDFTYEDDDLSIVVIKSLMDTLVTTADEHGHFYMTLGKTHKEISFD